MVRPLPRVWILTLVRAGCSLYGSSKVGRSISIPSSEGPVMSDRPPVLFIHGLWLHARSWDAWVELFTAQGYDASAPGWPGDPDTVAAAREHPEAIADHGIDDVVAHYATIIDALPSKPILIGHSFAG